MPPATAPDCPASPPASPPANPLEDPALEPYRPFFQRRIRSFMAERERICTHYGSLRAYANLHLTLGAQRVEGPSGSLWRWREYMPNAESLWLTTDKLNFQRHAKYRFKRCANNVFELELPPDALEHGTYVELRLVAAHCPESQNGASQNGASQNGKSGTAKALKRVPAFATWVEQNAAVPEQWCARLWAPQAPYRFRHKRPPRTAFPRIYEVHVGMAQSSLAHSGNSVGSYADFCRHILPRIKACGYTTVQLMGILEHPLYRSFGYQVSSYFAPSSRYGTPDGFKELVDTAHGLGLAVILDIPHGHASANTEQGLARYDGSNYLFTEQQNQWGTPSFDYGQEMARRFLLSNCRYWLEEFQVDGFRFDAVGNTLYHDFGADDDFSHVGRCFYDKQGQPRANVNGELYLNLANALSHQICPTAVTIAEEFSGMPGLTCPAEHGGLGFDYRFAMGIPDYWAKCIAEPRDMGSLWYEMTNHRPYDRTISYVECHDQHINGSDAMIWRLLGDEMYRHMGKDAESWNISRGLAFYRLMRLITLATADAGYLNFMGCEFGHPEWLDAEKHAHRQWHLADDPGLKYHALADWDKELMALVQRHLPDFAQPPVFRFIHEEKRLLAFERGQLLFVFNFHELEAQKNLLFAVSPGKYDELLSSDEQRFAGHGNLAVKCPPTAHFTVPLPGRAEGDIALYMPPLVGLVLENSK